MLREDTKTTTTMQENHQEIDNGTIRRKARRAREFYRYLHPDHILNSPPDSPVYHLDKIPNLSQAFLPHCQLTTWRCKARKAMVNFMDRDIMYFVSESSVQKSIVDGEEHLEFVEDPILASCTSAPLEGKICQLVLDVEPRQDNRPPVFVIPNLAKSPFSHMPIIAGPPHYRFYAGIPIRTAQGINIGSLAIMDDQPRASLTRDQEDYMAATAAQIMAHLESHRQAIEGSRALRMTAALQTFFTDSNTQPTLNQHSNPLNISIPNGKMSYCPSNHCSDGQERNGDRKSGVKVPRSTASYPLPNTPLQRNSISDTRAPLPASITRSLILQRAAILIRQCLDSANDSTVTFFGLGRNPLNTPESKPSKLTHFDESGRMQQIARRPARIAASCPPIDSSSVRDDLGYSTSVNEDFLRLLMKKYPEGHLWNLDDGESEISNDDSIGSPGRIDCSNRDISSRRYKRDTEIDSVRGAFPSARSVLFAPLWDADSALASYCLFVESDNEMYSFDANTDLSFLRTFCGSITTEISKREALLINKQKSDFAGSISHELRSPLHGILGSTEFLADTELSNFQQSLVKTIETCGKTLLDTISHILDYSKINSFEKQLPISNGGSTTVPEQIQSGGMDVFDEGVATKASPLSQVATNTDMAAILEEVVDSLVRGRTYNQNLDFTDIPHEHNDIPDRLAKKQYAGEQTTAYPELIVDIEPVIWLFLTHPGAVRRIFMNVAGNALKFTSHGAITISLALKPSSDDDQFKTMIFEVIDTGPGISSDFLDSKLFLPFSQENALSPGTGLGLSIVYNIAKMLGGWVDIKSTMGEGTTVRVELPLKRPNPTQISTQTSVYVSRPIPTRMSSFDSMSAIRNSFPNIDVAFYPEERDNVERRILSSYVTEWCQFQVSKAIDTAAIVIVDEKDLESLVQAFDRVKSQVKVIILCSETSKNRDLRNQSALHPGLREFECVTKPCGPRKLARALKAVLEKSLVDGVLAERNGSQQIRDWLKKSELESRDSQLSSGLTHLHINETDRSRTGRIASAEDYSTDGILDQSHQTTLSSISNANDSATDLAYFETNVSPFSVLEDKENAPMAVLHQDKAPSLAQKSNMKSNQQLNGVHPSHPTINTKNNDNTASDATLLQDRLKYRQPRILLVDDNKVNLRLLETYLRKKRQYTDLTKAEDGQQAVDAFISSSSSSSNKSTIRPDAFDLIFMDISMPIMDGFAATRAIREHEAMHLRQTDITSKAQSNQPTVQTRTGVFIIAMTGLAGAKDRTEGYESGCDVYMTKPVSFKEVSKLLDQWEMNQWATSTITEDSTVPLAAPTVIPA